MAQPCCKNLPRVSSVRSLSLSLLRRTKVASGKCDTRTHGYYRLRPRSTSNPRVASSRRRGLAPPLAWPCARGIPMPRLLAVSVSSSGGGSGSSDWGDNCSILIGDATPAGARRASKSVMCQSSCDGTRWSFWEGVAVGHCDARNGTANGHLESIHVRFSVIRPS